MATVQVRYIVNDLDPTVAFYRDRLGFTVDMHAPAGFAMLSRGDLRLLLNRPGAGAAGQAMPDGRLPEPGGWNRIVVETEDLAALVGDLRAAGATFRNEIVQGNGGKQILLEDPSRNAIELLKPGQRGA